MNQQPLTLVHVMPERFDASAALRDPRIGQVARDTYGDGANLATNRLVVFEPPGP
jgi:hypothetical protein